MQVQRRKRRGQTEPPGGTAKKEMGLRVKKTRVEVLGLKQSELAAELGYKDERGIGKQMVVSAWEVGRAYPPHIALQRMARLAGVSVGYFFGENDSGNAVGRQRAGATAPDVPASGSADAHG